MRLRRAGIAITALLHVACHTEALVVAVDAGPAPPSLKVYAWKEVATFQPDDPAFARFGETLALEGDDAYVVSRPRSGPLRWRLTHLRRDAGTWTKAAEVSADDVGAFDGVPLGLSVSGPWVWLGVPRADASHGEVWRFPRDLSTPLRLAPPGDFEGFGRTLSASEQWLFVGATMQDSWRGLVYVYRIDGAEPSLTQTLSSAEPAPRASFGRSITQEDLHLFIGAPGCDPLLLAGVCAPGTVEVFTRRPDLTWQAMARWPAPSPLAGFGTSSAANGEGQVVIGAPYGVCEDGALECYDRAGEALLETRTATTPDPKGLRPDIAYGRDELFGLAVAAAGAHVAIGAPGDGACAPEVGTNACAKTGVVHLFTDTEAPVRLRARRSEKGGLTGYAVALDEDTLLVGSPELKLIDQSAKVGAVHIFERTEQ